MSERTARAKLWATDGTVIYSNDPTGVGEKFPTKENLREALGGENALEIKLPDAPENTRERYLGTLMEVYTPIIFPGTATPQGALEIYQYYEPTAERIHALRQRLFWSIGVGFVVLYGGLVSIVWGGWRTIKRQQVSLTMTNSNLQAAHDKLLSANTQLSKEIAERQRAEEANKKLEAQLRQSQKMEAMGTLAGGIAHDFNNMLSAVIGFTELALEDLPAGSPPADCLRQVLTASTRATALVRQIPTFSRQNKPVRNPVQLPLLVKEVLELLRALFPSTIEIRQQIAEDPGTVLADPTQMHQVLLNLCVNAEHAMRDTGGVLEVGVDAVEVDETLIGHHPELHPGPSVRLTVRDTGCGIEPQLLERVFDPFFTTKEIGEGTGMGLAVAHGIVSSYGGALIVQSAVGAGTTFTLYLPRIEAPADTKVHAEGPILQRYCSDE